MLEKSQGPGYIWIQKGIFCSTYEGEDRDYNLYFTILPEMF